VFIQGRWSFARLLHAPFGKLANLALSATLGKARGRPTDYSSKTSFKNGKALPYRKSKPRADSPQM
jgi:hypothetical protein